MKRFLSMFLVFVFLIVGIPSFNVFADTSGYTEVSSAEEFDAIRNAPSGKYLLTADITLPSDYEPFSFSGELIGNNEKELRTITVDIGEEDSLNGYGLFSIITGSVKIKNIHIKGSVTSGSGDRTNYYGYAGGVAGVAEKLTEGAIIENCINSADISTLALYAAWAQGTAGIVGRDYSTENKAMLTIKNCINKGTIGVSGKLTTNHGGIAGLSSAKIIGCANFGDVAGYKSVGGIIGDSEGAVIEKCYNTANITASYGYAGGIIGSTGMDQEKISSSLEISNSFSIGNVLGDNSAGITGGMSANATVTVKNSYTKADMVAAGNINASNCYYLSDAHTADSIDGTTPLSFAEMTDLLNFKNFDSNIWCVKSNYIHPQLIENPYLDYYNVDINYADIDLDYEDRYYPDDSYDVRFEEEDSINEDSKYTNIMSTISSWFPVKVDASWVNCYGEASSTGSFTEEKCEAWFDGDRHESAVYLGDKAVSATITLDLISKKTFNKIVIPDGSRNTAIFTVSVSNDKKTWTEVGSYSKRGIYHKYCYFETQTARYIKFDVTDITDQTSGRFLGIQWMEIEIYNVDGKDDYRLRRMVEIAEETINSATSEDCYDSERFAALTDAVDSAKTYLSGNSKTPVENEERKIKIEELHCKLLAYRTRDFAVYEKILENVKEKISFKNKSMSTSQIKTLNDSVSNTDKNIWKNMVKNGGEILWEDLGDASDENLSGYENKTPPSASVMDRLYSMAVAATHEYSYLRGNPQLLEDLYYALKIVNKYWVGTNSHYRHLESWWWQIGFSSTYGRVCALLYDYFEYDKLAEIAQDFVDSQPNDYVFYEMAGFVQVATGMACMGAILKREDLVRAYPEIAFADVKVKSAPDETKNGFFVDGSMIYHGGHPWISGYGLQIISYYAEAYTLLKDTPFMFENEKVKIFAETVVKETVFPLMQDMLMPSFTNGRHMAQEYCDYGAGYKILIALADLAYAVLDEPLKTETLSRIKGKIMSYNLVSPDEWKRWSNNANLFVLMEDDSILPSDPQIIKNKVYRFMDVVAHRREDYMMILNMHSTRTATYEAAGGENRRGWYSRAGSTLFYEENDYSHYNDDYYVSFEAKRYPGVTAINCLDYDTASIDLGYYTVSDTAKQDFVGSVSLGEYGASAYEADQFIYDEKNKNHSRTPRMARKSYFMFDDEVVMVGSDITNSITTSPTETTIDQRIIEKDVTDNLKINGVSLNTALLSDTVYNNVKTVYLKGRNNSEFGYYFPENTALTVNKVFYERAGTESNENDTKTYTNNFATLYINHGAAPNKAKYAYAVIPGATEEELSAYNENPDFEILMQTDECHAVYEKTLGITAINNYGESAVTVNGITVPGRVCVIVSTKGDEVTLAVSDPTMKRTDSVEIILPYVSSLVVSKSESMNISENSVTADFNETYGDSLLITYKKELPETLEGGLTSYISTEDSYYGVSGFFLLTYGAIEDYSGYDVCEYGVEIKLENGNTERIKSRFPADLNGRYGILIHGAGITKEGSYEITPYTIYEKESASFERYGKTYTYSK